VLLFHRFDLRRKAAFVQSFSAKRLSVIAAGSLMQIMIIYFQGMFTSIKNALFIWSGGFQFDEVQANIDAATHLAPILGAMSASATRCVCNYGVVWFPLSFGIVYFVASLS
jgi:hypothetical protein